MLNCCILYYKIVYTVSFQFTNNFRQNAILSEFKAYNDSRWICKMDDVVASHGGLSFGAVSITVAFITITVRMFRHNSLRHSCAQKVSGNERYVEASFVVTYSTGEKFEVRASDNPRTCDVKPIRPGSDRIEWVAWMTLPVFNWTCFVSTY